MSSETQVKVPDMAHLPESKNVDEKPATAVREGSPDGSSSSSDSETEKPETQKTKRGAFRITLIMISLAVAVFLAALDVTIVTTALPTIAEYFKSSSAYSWIGGAYVLATAAATPIWGKVSDIYGRKPVLIAANVVFFVGALVCGLADSIAMLIAGRAVQGVGGGGLLVLVNIVIGDLFSPRERGTYYGLIGGVWAVALSFGPIVGGAFAEKVSWRWCFYINLPFDGIAVLGLIFFLDLKTPKTPFIEGLLAIDWAGALLIIGGTLTVLLGLQYGGETFPWDSATVICLIVFGVVLLVLFFLVQWKVAKYPMTPLRLFTNRSQLACFLVDFLHGFVFISAVYYLPLYFQGALGATPILSGVYLLATSLAIAFAGMTAGAYIGTTGKPLYPTILALAFMTLGIGLYIDLDASSSWAKIFLFQIIAGIGIGPLFQAPMIALQGRTAPADIAVATSAYEFTRNIATAISIVVGGVIFDNKISNMQPELSAHLPQSVVEILVSGGAGTATGIIDTLPPAQKAFAQMAYADSIRPMWYLYTALAGLGLIVSFFIGRQELSSEHKETETGLEAEEANRLAHLQLEKEKRARKAERKARKSGEIAPQEV